MYSNTAAFASSRVRKRTWWTCSVLSEAKKLSIGALMLLCSSSRARCHSRLVRPAAEVSEDLAGDEALEAADDLRLGLPLGGAPADVVEGRPVAAQTRDDDPVQGGVGLPVAAAVEPVSGRLAARRRDRAGAAELRERGLGADPPGVVADDQEHLRRRARAHPVRPDQLGRALADGR